MALYFSEAVAAYLAGKSITLAFLARLDFPGAEGRYWMGHGNIELGGEIWQGLGEFVSLSGLTRALNDVAVPLTLTLSGVDDAVVALAHRDAADLQARAAVIYLQPFTDAAMPLGAPVAIWTGSMDRLEFSGDVGSQSLSLVCEGLFTTRARAAFALMSDINQQRLHPGDTFFEHVAGVIEKRIAWP